MSIDATNKHAVLLYKSESRCGLTGSGQDVLVACFPQEGEETVGFCCDSRAAGECIERDTLAKEEIADWSSNRGAMGNLLSN